MEHASIEACFADFGTRDWERRAVEGTVDVAVVGLGRFARNRALPAIDASAYCELTTLVSKSPDEDEPLADEYGATTVLTPTEFFDGRATGAYDALYVATPNAYHAEYTEAAAAMGKHVLCEKPLATSVADAEAMVEACDEAGVTLMTAYRLQTEPSVRRIREIVQGGLIGDPVHVSGWFAYRASGEPGAVTEWRRDPSIAGGGAMIDLGIYPLNTARFILGADPVAASATTTPFAADTSADVDAGDGAGDSTDLGAGDGTDEGSQVEKRATFELTFPDDVTVAGLASFDIYPDNRLQVLGTQGRAVIVSPFGGVVSQEVLVERGEAETSYAGQPVDEVAEEFDYFAYCVLTGTEPEPDGRDGVADLRAIRAVYESAETGRRVDV